MAVVRPRSAPPYGMIIFASLFVVATVAAVLLYLQWGTASEGLATANATFASNQARLNTTEEELKRLKGLLAGNPDMTDMDVRGRIESAVRGSGSDKATLLDALAAVASERDTLRRTVEDFKTQLAGLTTQDAGNKTAATDRVNALQKDVDDARAQLTKALEEVAKANAARDAAVKVGEERLNEMMAQLDQMRRDALIKEDEYKATVARLNEVIQQMRDLVEKTRGGEKVARGQPDGTVRRVTAANGELWIDLSAEQRIMPGMTFTVYDPRTGVRYDNEELAAGKGAIEVISPGINGQPSLCRITRTAPNQTIQPGDFIANVAYNTDKNRKSRFTIVGNIDLDGDGVASADERDRLVDMISRWGGVVENTVTTQTDYVVAGAPPSPAALNMGDGATTQQGSAVDERGNERERYNAAVTEAKQLSIPVLNGNRFLSMIGYYSTTVVRR